MNSIRGMAYWRTGERRYELELDGEVCLAKITIDGKIVETRPEDKVIIRHVISELRSGEYEFCSTSCSLYDDEIHTLPNIENRVHFIPDNELNCYKIDSILSKSFLSSIPKRVKEKPERYDIWEDDTLSSEEKFNEWFMEWTLSIQKLIRDMDSGVLDAIRDSEFQACMYRIKKNARDKRINKLIRCQALAGRLLCGVVALSLVYIFLPKNIKFKPEYSINNFLDKTCGINYFSVDNSNVSIEDIRNALASNPYFSREDKALFGSLWRIIEENRDFINLNAIVKNITEFEFIPSERFGFLDEDAVAGYSSIGFSKNAIYLFQGYEDLSEAQKNSVKLHEVGHGLTGQYIFSDAPFDIIFHIFESASSLRISLLEELANELFARDYCSYLNGAEPTFDNFIGYNHNMPACYALCEIVGRETMREYKFTKDVSLLVEALSSIDGDIERAYKFLHLFDELDFAMDYEKDKIIEIRVAIGQELSYYYEARFNRPIYDDVYMCLYLYNTWYRSPRMDVTLKRFFESENLDFKISSLKKFFAHEGRDYSIIEANGRTYIVNEENRYMDEIQKDHDEKVMTIKPISS